MGNTSVPVKAHRDNYRTNAELEEMGFPLAPGLQTGAVDYFADLKPTKEQRQEVQTLSSYGLRNKEIAQLIKHKGRSLSIAALQNHFMVELRDGKANLIKEVSMSLKRRALQGDIRAITLVLAMNGYGAVETTEESYFSIRDHIERRIPGLPDVNDTKEKAAWRKRTKIEYPNEDEEEQD